jgi:alcohol dehydrogenase class IV
MKNEKDFSTYRANIISITNFGAIDHLESILHSINLTSPLIIIDSQVQHITRGTLITAPLILDITKEQNTILQEIETHIKKTTIDCIIIISAQEGLDMVKLAMYEFFRDHQESSLPLIVIPTSYTTYTLSDALCLYQRKEKNMVRYQDIRLQPKMIIIDERAVNNGSARDKALAVVAIIGGFIDILHHTAFGSYEYFLAIEGLSLCKTYGYQAAHSPHDSESRHQILCASHLLSLITLELGNGILTTMVQSLHKVSGVNPSLLMKILLNVMIEVETKGNMETFQHAASYIEESSIEDFMYTSTTQILEPIHPPIENRLYDILDEETSFRQISLQHLKDASTLTFGQTNISIHPSIIDEQDLIRYFESAFWGYSLPKECI